MDIIQWEYEQEGWYGEKEFQYSDGMDFEKIIDNDLEEEDDMNAIDAAFMRGYVNRR